MTRPDRQNKLNHEAEVIYAARQEVTSLYIHVPFCGGRCHYCDFYTMASPAPGSLEIWQEGILHELSRLAGEADDNGVLLAPLQTLYFGGGTPSFVPPRMIASIIRNARGLFGLDGDSDITLEANPESAGKEEQKHLLDQWREAGVNRISFGVQSMSDRLLAAAGRRHTAAEAAFAVRAAKTAGFKHIACDLITGLPGQSMADLDDTLDQIEKLPLDHLSAYALSVEEGTPFDLLRRKNPQVFPDDDLEREMTHRLIERLGRMGFIHYEISNFAREGAESRHNLVYWKADSYLAAGPSAASYLGGIRRSQPASLADWYQGVTDPEEGPFSAGLIEERLDEKAARIETMVLGLRLMEGVSRRRFFERHGTGFEDVFGSRLNRLQEEGLVHLDEGGVRLTARGLDFADYAARSLL